MTDEKVETLKKIQSLETLKDVQHFLGFANFYRCFIKDYAKIILPKTNSTSLEKHEWQSTLEIEQAQKQLVQSFKSAPVLRHFDAEEPAIVKTDASNFALQESYHRNMKDDYTRLPTTLENSLMRKSTTTQWIRNYSPSSTSSRDGGDTWKEPNPKFKSSPTNRTWSYSRRQRCCIGDKCDGGMSSPDMTSRSSSALAGRTAMLHLWD